MIIKQVSRSMYHRRQFRTLARDNCGESMEPAEGEIIYFGYSPADKKLKGHPIACGSLKPAHLLCRDPSVREYYYWVTFLFVKDTHKKCGYGRQLLTEIESNVWKIDKRSIRVEVARKAIGFFEKCGYCKYAEPWQSAAGSSYFKHIQPMQKDFKEPEEEIWDVQ